MTKQKSDFQQNKVDEILEKAARNILNIIESGKNLKWEKEWKGEPLWGMPFNPVSGHVFTGFNRLLLLIEMHDRETQDPRFLTFNQIAKLNEEHGTQCHVRKGEKACYLLKPVIFNKKRKAGEEDEAEQDQDQEGCSQARTQKAVFFQAYL
jgi:antirestriction protein ArdC